MRRLLLVAVFLVNSHVWAEDLTAITKRVDEHYNHLTSLRTRFTEHYAGLGMDRTEIGTLYLKKPGRMRWEYTTPVGKVFVLDGKFAWSYTPRESQAERMPGKDVGDLRSPLRFLLGHTQLTRELDQLAISQVAGGYRISGLPKGMGERVKQLLLDVSPDGQISHIRLEEVDGAVTEFSFEGSQENVALPETLFHFNPPAGVTVVNGMPPV